MWRLLKWNILAASSPLWIHYMYSELSRKILDYHLSRVFSVFGRWCMKKSGLLLYDIMPPTSSFAYVPLTWLSVIVYLIYHVQVKNDLRLFFCWICLQSLSAGNHYRYKFSDKKLLSQRQSILRRNTTFNF